MGTDLNKVFDAVTQPGEPAVQPFFSPGQNDLMLKVMGETIAAFILLKQKGIEWERSPEIYGPNNNLVQFKYQYSEAYKKDQDRLVMEGFSERKHPQRPPVAAAPGIFVDVEPGERNDQVRAIITLNSPACNGQSALRTAAICSDNEPEGLAEHAAKVMSVVLAHRPAHIPHPAVNTTPAPR